LHSLSLGKKVLWIWNWL